MKNLMSVIN